jgi:hypothetical protein
MREFADLRSLLALAIVGAMVLRCANGAPPPGIVWKLDDPRSVAGVPAEVLGSPRIDGPADGRYAVFNGRTDGLILPAAPLAGWKAFTVEVCFRPDADGPAAQRFIHLEDEAGRTLTIETRIVGGQWALDTHLADGTNKVTLLDVARLHPSGRWYWATLRYDGKTMTSFINGRPELSGTIAFAPMGAGHIGIGVRMNKVYWFKGAIRELRFYPAALADSDLAGPP